MAVGRYLVTIALFAATAVFADTPPPWTIEAITAHPRWVSFVQKLEASYEVPIAPSFPSNACRKVIETLPASARSIDPVDLCISVTLIRLDNGRSSYKPPKEFAEDKAINRKFIGIGLEIAKDSAKDSPLRVVTPIYGSPGERGGILAGDDVIEVDGVDFRPLTIEQTVKVMRGEVGTVMRLTILRKGHSEPLKFAIKREEIRIAAVRPKLLEDGVVYARISQFRSDVSDEWGKKLVSLLSGGKPRPTGLVLDLRGNQGGLLDTIAPMASWFAKPGVAAVSITGRTGVKTYSTQTPTVAPLSSASVEPLHEWLSGVPIVVLVNEKTAGAAEALTQFLREVRSARVLGQQTAGSPYVHTMMLVGDDASMNLLTGRILSPLGKSWPAGLSPDQVLTTPPGPYEWGADANDVWLNDAVTFLRSSTLAADNSEK
jgi:carboxyl-terminal processing protease